MITYNKKGGRTVELFLPFDVDGKKVEAITFSPVRFDHTIRWREGEWKSILGLMAALAEVDEKILRSLAYPDTDRVMGVFVDMLPPEIRGTITEREQVVADQPEPMIPTATPQPSAAPPFPPFQPPQMNGNGLDAEGHPLPKFNMDVEVPGEREYTPQEKELLGVDLNG